MNIINEPINSGEAMNIIKTGASGVRYIEYRLWCALNRA